MVVLGIVGPPQSGKKTIAKILRRHFGFKILEFSAYEQKEYASCSAEKIKAVQQELEGDSEEPVALNPVHPYPFSTKETIIASNDTRIVNQREKQTCTELIGGETALSEQQLKERVNGWLHRFVQSETDVRCEGQKRNETDFSLLETTHCDCVRKASSDAIADFSGDLGKLLDFVTQRWRENFVILGLTTVLQVQELRKRPFFALVAVDAPLGLRASRLKDMFSLEFPINYLVEAEDATCFRSAPSEYGESDGVRACMALADVHIRADDLTALRRKVLGGPWLTGELIRPSWDTYFMRLAFLAATRSNCMKRRVGALVVCCNRVIATGYNGTPSQAINCNEGGCARCNSFSVSQGRELEACECIHAEANALLEAGRNRATDCILYVTSLPCLSCAKLAVQCVGFANYRRRETRSA